MWQQKLGKENKHMQAIQENKEQRNDKMVHQ